MCKKALHRMTPANTYHHPAKGPECRECKRTYMRDYMRKLRARLARNPERAERLYAPLVKLPATVAAPLLASLHVSPCGAIA